MRCAEARRTIVESSWGELSAPRRLALDRHLDGCASCRIEARVERVLCSELVMLRDEAPVAIDVVSRVTGEIARRPPRRDEVPASQAGWAAAAAVLISAALIAGFVGSLPPWSTLLAFGRSLLLAAEAFVGGTATALVTLLTVPLRLISVLFEGLSAFGSVLRLLQPAAAVSIVIAYLIMGGIIATVFWRDWSVRAPQLQPRSTER